MDPSQIRFRTGDQLSFIATRNFTLGATGANIPKGSEVLFDGSTVHFAGQTFSFPQLRGAIRLDWVVPSEHYDENDSSYGRPERANIQVRHPTKGGNPMAPPPKVAIPTTLDDEREVGNYRQHAQETAARNKNYVRGNPVNVVVPGEAVRSQYGFEVVEPQDGVEVPGRMLHTAAGERAKQERTTLTAESAALALQRATKAGIIVPGRGITQEEMLERMSPEERDQYLAEHAAYKATHVDVDAIQTRTIVSSVSRAQPQRTEGILVTPDVGHGTETIDLVGYGNGKPRENVIFEDGIAFKTTNGPDRYAPTQSPRSAAQQEQRVVQPAKESSVGNADVRRMVAKAVCPDFPDNYDFAQPLKKKMARLQADYEDRPDVLRAVFAAEGDDVKGILLQEFPSAFAG
jgi:hypothetical protein